MISQFRDKTSNMFHSISHSTAPRLPSSFLITLSVLLTGGAIVLYSAHTALSLNHSQWLHQPRIFSPTSPLFPSSNFLLKKCDLLAVIITSESDFNNGTIDAWYESLPSNQTDQVCCVAVRRSTDTFYHLDSNTHTCDILHVPMVHIDEYLTISEKIRLVFSKISSYYSFNWLLKTDADSFVCFSRILRLLQNFDHLGVIQLGYAESRNILLEDPRHYWYDPSMTDIVHNPRQSLEPGTGLYHPYMQGAGYILSRGAMTRLRELMPSLRYSPMEDAMVGSWLLSLNAHHVVLNLDLRGERGRCNLPPQLYISHNRKGGDVLLGCHEQHPNCSVIPEDEVSVSAEVRVRSGGSGIRETVAFVITARMERRHKQFMDLYHSIRAAFPMNEIHVADLSTTDTLFTRLLHTVKDPHLHGLSLPNDEIGPARNKLIDLVKSPFVVILKDEQRVSWETMIGRMVRAVHRGDCEISTGFLKFNPNMNTSISGLFAFGFHIRVSKGTVWKHWVEYEGKFPEDNVLVNGTSGFIVARTELLRKYAWGDFGMFTDEEWHVRLQMDGIRMMLVNSGIRHGYHYELDHHVRSQSTVRVDAQKTCAELAKNNILKIAGLNDTLDCEKQIFKSTSFNSTDSQSFTVSW